MPLPMVHLLLAKTIERKLRKVNDKYFILGSIAPDSIHMRNGTNRVDKHRTHMFYDGYGNEDSIDRNLKNVEATLKNTDSYDPVLWEFTKGYCIHTMLDMIWISRMFNVFAATLRSGGINFNDIRTKYYEETNYCDAQIYLSGGWCKEYQETLEDIKPVGFANLLSEKEVGLWREEVLRKMKKYENYQNEPSYYITYKSVSEFVDKYSENIIDYFDAWGYRL